MEYRAVVEQYGRLHGLSAAELRVLLGGAAGEDNTTTAQRLGYSGTTVRTYWHRILTKTGQKSQRAVLAELFRFAVLERDLFEKSNRVSTF